jgi:hypothetical protein
MVQFELHHSETSQQVLLRYGDATEIVQVYTLNENLAGVRASLRGYIFFLNGRNRDFVKKSFQQLI